MEITDEQLHHDVIVHAQAFLSLAHHPISHGSAERPWKLTTTFTSGAEHVTYHESEDAAQAALDTLVEFFTRAQVDLASSGAEMMLK